MLLRRLVSRLFFVGMLLLVLENSACRPSLDASKPLPENGSKNDSQSGVKNPKEGPEYSDVLKVDTEQAHQVLAVAMRISEASTRLQSRKLNKDMLRSLMNVAFEGESVKIDDLIDLEAFLRVFVKHQSVPPPQIATPEGE